MIVFLLVLIFIALCVLVFIAASIDRNMARGLGHIIKRVEELRWRK